MNYNLDIVVWDVQHGNAIYMKTPNGKNVMFDIGIGSYAKGYKFSPLRHLKYSWGVDCLHYLVISHPHADHISDIHNIFSLDLKPLVLNRPKHIEHDLIYKANQSKDSEIVKKYIKLDNTYNGPVPDMQNPNDPANYGGVKITIFPQNEKDMSNLNNYSSVAVIEYAGEKIIIPGDIETPGWKVILERSSFQQAIKGTTIFVASHHGREAGFHSDLFQYFKPELVIVSDGKYSSTSVTDKYGYHARGFRVTSRSTRNLETRKVLTTRNDEAIWVKISRSGKQITIK